MGTGYTRNDTSNNIADGNIINASDLDGEFDAVESAFNSSTGHTHDGTAAEGGAITVVGPVQDLVVSATEVKPKTTNTLDLGTSALLYKDAYLQGNMYFRDTALKIVSSADGQLDIDADVELELVAPTVDIDASTALTVDTASTTFTSTVFNVTGSANITGDLDVDNININGNTIISTDTNGAINITPNGTGAVNITATTNITGDLDVDNININGNTIISTDTNGDINISPDGTGTVVINTDLDVDNINVNGNTIISTDTNGDINLSPDGTGTVVIDTDLDVDNINVNGNTVSSTDTNGDINLSPNGTGTVVINTDLDVDNININGNTIISTDTNGNIALTPNGTGEVDISKVDIDSGAIDGTVIGANSAAAITGTTITGTSFVTTGDMTFGDNDKAIFGAGSDLEIYHDGSNSIINEAGTGSLKFQYGGTDGVVFDSSGNVGIGTTVPSHRISVEGTANNQNSEIKVTATAVASGYLGSNSNGFNIGTDSYGIVFKTGVTGGGSVGNTGTERMRIDSSGRVGVNVTSLSKRLSVGVPLSDTDGLALIYSGDPKGGILLSPTTGEVRMGAINSSGTYFPTFYSNNSEAMRITSSGIVGIGTTSPATATGGGIDIERAGGASVRLDDTTNTVTGELQVYSSGMNLATVTNHNILFSTNNSERMRIDSSGNVGIGVTPATTQTLTTQITNGLSLFGNNTTPYGFISSNHVWATGTGDKYLVSGYGASYYKQYSGVHTWATAPSGTANNPITFSEAMRIDSSGKLFKGRTTAFGGANIANEGAEFSAIGNAALGIGRGSADLGACVRFFSVPASGTGTIVGSISITASSTAYNTSSDYRLKENITDADDAGSKIDAIQVRQFDWIADGSHQDYGMIAQELQTVAPEAVSGNPDSDEMMGVDYSKLVPMLIKEVQSLRARVAELENN